MLQCNSKTKKCAISGSSSSYTEFVRGPTQRIKLKIIFTYLPSYLHFFQNNFRGRVHSLCMDFKTFHFLLVCIIMSVIVESYMSLPTTHTARGQSFFQLDWSNGWKEKKNKNGYPILPPLVILFANVLNKINHFDRLFS